MNTLRRFVSGLAVLGCLALPATVASAAVAGAAVASAAAAEPTPSPSAPPCKAGSMKLTFPGDIAVASAPDTSVSRSAIMKDTVGYYYKDLAFTFQMWPDKGDLGSSPAAAMVTSTRQTLHWRRMNSPRPLWQATGIKPPTIFPGAQTYFRLEVSFPSSSVVTTYTAKLIVTAAVCGDTVLGSSSGMKFGYKTSTAGNPPSSATPAAPAPSASAKKPKPTTKASASPQPDASGGEVVPVDGETSPATGDSAGTDLAAGSQEDSGSPLPWLAGLGVTAILVAIGLLFWLRRSSNTEDEEF